MTLVKVIDVDRSKKERERESGTYHKFGVRVDTSGFKK